MKRRRDFVRAILKRPESNGSNGIGWVFEIRSTNTERFVSRGEDLGDEQES